MSPSRSCGAASAEQAFLLMIALAKQAAHTANLVTESRLRAAGHTIRPYETRYTGASNFGRIPDLRTLEGATFGQVGMGEIGRELALRAAAFGMRVLYTQRTRLPPGEEFPARAIYVTLPDLLAQADYVSLNLPTNASTRGIIDAEAFRQLKPGAMLINVSRAQLIDRTALLEALRGGRLVALGADVWYEEPVKADDPILGFPNVLLTPHTAVAGREYALRDLEEMCFKLWRHVAASAPARS
jgi:phosphoglycerate dehydrogenase-like enzyme